MLGWHPSSRSGIRGSHTPRVLRGRDEKVFYSVWDSHTAEACKEQEGRDTVRHTFTKLIVCASKFSQSGRSKGYAFIEFECDEVAKVVADTMNNYLMFNKLLKCETAPSLALMGGGGEQLCFLTCGR